MTNPCRRGWCRWAVVLGGVLLTFFSPQARSAVGNAAVGSPVAAARGSQPGCLRVLEDRALGLRWRWESHSGARPGQWVPMAADLADGCTGQLRAEVALPRRVIGKQAGPGVAGRTASGSTARNAVKREVARPVIQVGEHVVVIQDDGEVVARLPGVALAAALAGRPLPVRLKVGNGGFGKLAGRVVEAQAVAKGIARWSGEMVSGGAGW